MCHRKRVITTAFAATVARQARGRSSHRSSAGRASITTPSCTTADGDDAHAGRQHVRHPLPGEPQHAHRVGPRTGEQHQRPEGRGRGQQPPTATGAHERPVGIQETQLLAEPEHHQVVEVAERCQPGALQPVEQQREHRQHRQQEPRPPPVQGVLHRGHHGQEQEDGEEPQRHRRGVARRVDDAGRHPDTHKGPGQHQPHRDEDHRRWQHPLEARRRERRPGAGPPPQGEGAGEPGREEEQRHDLEDPGQRVGPRRDLEDVAHPQAAVRTGLERGHGPVAEGHHEDARGADQVDEAVAARRRGVGERGKPRGRWSARSHGTSVRCRAPPGSRFRRSRPWRAHHRRRCARRPGAVPLRPCGR